MPTYYIMDLADDMPAAVAKEMPSAAEIAACRWLPDDELAVYAGEYERNGFQGGLNWYRSRTVGRVRVRNCSCFPAARSTCRRSSSPARATGASTSGPARSKRCRTRPAREWSACHLLDGAGHWVQQEQSEAVSRLLIDFLRQRDG